MAGFVFVVPVPALRLDLWPTSGPHSGPNGHHSMKLTTPPSSDFTRASDSTR